MKEKWKPIIGFEDTHQISNMARVRVIKTGKFIKSHVGKEGYEFLNIESNGVRKNFKVHRLVAIHFIPNPLHKAQVNHIDCDKLNNIKSNLEWATRKENMQHSWNRGLKIKYKNKADKLRAIERWILYKELLPSEVLKLITKLI